MRSVLIRCLVVLLAFALAGGNAHARLHLTPAEQPAAHTHHHHSGQADHHGPAKESGPGCCCDCLGCVSAFNLSPEIASVAPVDFSTSIRFPLKAAVLHGRVLVPEPKPPRPIALS
jgi:hypothetical protein